MFGCARRCEDDELKREPADIRIGLSDLHLGKGGCPTARAVKVRGGRSWPSRMETGGGLLVDFALGPLMNLLDQVEFGTRGMERVLERVVLTREEYYFRGELVHPGLVDWTIDLVKAYLAARDTHLARQGPSCPIPVRGEWVVRTELNRVDRRGFRIYERFCWGRRYESADGSVREIWLLSLGAVKDRSVAQLALGAYVAAHGQVPGVSTSKVGAAMPRLVRLVGFGGTGQARVLDQRSGVEVGEYFADAAKEALAAVIDTDVRVPGGDCAGCGELPDCGSVVRVRLLPDLAPSRALRTRTVSATDLRTYSICPKKYHLVRQLKLRDPNWVEGTQITLGRGVDALLNKRHGGVGAVRCRPDDSWPLSTIELAAEQRDRAGRMLAQHSGSCPLTSEVDSLPQVQRTVSAYDAHLDVVFVGTPDLLYVEDGGWVWRETKTSSKPLWVGRSLLRRYPQLALGVLFLAVGAVDSRTSSGRVELEHLQVDDRAVEELDVSQPAVVAEARSVVQDLLVPLLADTRFEASPGRDCRSCEVLRWCPEGREHVRRTSEGAEKSASD